ncbi:DUF3019 domain-containing protein [Shewanella mesophila]|uniref:DUF3019 domain-containing protein n=1 Tax=Shewanella mesophila TaxID=2864208 RepID=UPI001C65E637|nr:DUF3019 domain-containing protein [Shewanella mesophila]QYJ85509.1 DUF3019 domain-containing protein [Shewanella mesophila]
MTMLLIWVSVLSVEVRAATTKVEIKPQTCAVIEAGTPCHMQLKISYHLLVLEQTCIWIALREKPEQCFDSLSVNHLFDLSLVEDTQVFIKDLNDKVLDEVTIQVAIYQPANTRRRRGLNWNLL